MGTGYSQLRCVPADAPNGVETGCLESSAAPPLPARPSGRGAFAIAVRSLGKMQDPRVCEVGNLGENQQVIPPEAVRALPGIAVFVEALASAPKCCTVLVGYTVSGVSTPMRRTVYSFPCTRTRMVSPSMTRTTVASIGSN